MADNDESGLVKAFNRFFKEQEKLGIAYRRKQSRFQSQFLDIMIDSAEDDFHDVAIEHKSFKTSSSNKLYFSQHFSKDTDGRILQPGHQIRRIREFEIRSGYELYLAVEIRRGRGTAKELYIVDWDVIFNEFQKWDNDEEDAMAGFDREWFKENAIEVERESSEWQIPESILRKDS